MEHWIEQISAGRAGFVTAYGMGGVFFALVCLYLFTLAMGTMIKIWRFRARHDERASRPQVSAGEARERVTAADEEGGKIAAAIAVAYALQLEKSRAALCVGNVNTAAGTGTVSAWRAAGRLELMSPPTRHG
jgi:Na+-transporting methylmalonyl-CoA/oxaloacetate decarboxylase gamma subunit